MNRGFFPRRQRFRRRCHNQWFYQNNMPNENFWMDTWDMPQNEFPEGSPHPPWWNQPHPEQERPYNVGFDNCTRGSYHRRPYRGRSYSRSSARSKNTSSKGRRNFQNPSSSPFLINVPVKPKDSQLDEESPSQTDSVASPEAVASGITKITPHTQNQDSVLRNFSFKLKDCEATEDLLSQTVSVLSPGVSTEDKKSSCSAEVLQNTEEKDSVLTETSAKQNDTDDSQAYVVAPALDSSNLPNTTIDVHCEPVLVREKDNELTEISVKQNDTDESQAYVVTPALDSSNLPNALNDIHCEPVLVSGKETGLTETSAKQNDTDDSQAYVVAPALDSSSVPNSFIDVHCEPVLVRVKVNELTETSAKQNDTDDSQAYVVAPALDTSNLPNTLNDIHCEPVLVSGKDTGLTETSAKQNDTDVSQAYVVAPALDSSNLPNSPTDVHCEPVLVREKDNELTESSAKQNDTDNSQAYVVAPALESSNLPNTLNDIHCVPVLLRRKVIGLAENQTAWAPEDYQEPPWSVNQTDHYFKESECYKDSVSTTISSNEKHNIESLVKSKSSSPKIHHSINSKHSSINETSKGLRCQSPRSHVRQECSSRSPGKQNLSTERQDRSSKLSCRRESSHKQKDSPQREKRTSKSPYRQEQSSQKRDCSPKASLMQEHGVKSMRKRKHSSNSPSKRKQNTNSQKLDRWKEKKLGRSCCCHCYCHCQQSCSPFQENLCQRCCSSSYLSCKIEHLNVSKEISNVYEMPCHLSPRRSIENEKEIRESRQVVEPNVPVIEKEKGTTPKTERKALKPSTKKTKTSSPCHLNAEEAANSSVPSWTPEDRSAAVLARKEELEQAYLQDLLNFGVIAIMLVEKEPCMIEAMSSALRANLRKIGEYYERLLKNYIDSLTEAS